MSENQAKAIAHAIDLDVDAAGICHACLASVGFPLEAGDAREVRRALAFFTPLLWDEGLERPVRDALECARQAGVPDAEAAVADVEANGSRSRVVREVVLRLAADLMRRSRGDLAQLGYVTFPN